MVRARVADKLRRQPVEDYRIDFEDGYGNRPDSEEDGHAVSAAREVATGLAAGTLPPCIGIRIKPFTPELSARSFRTLELFLSRLLEDAGRLPPNFVVTLAKVTSREQVSALAGLLSHLERRANLPEGVIPLEIMSTIAVIPPAAAAAVAVSKPSQCARPGSFTCTCVSTRPGNTMAVPSVSIERRNDGSSTVKGWSKW